jgi:hypothetical protein
MGYKYSIIACIAFLVISCTGKTNPEEETDWKLLGKNPTIAALDSFLTNFPETKRKKEIALKREKLLFLNAKFENTIFHYKYYQKEFPQGKNIKEINTALNSLKADNVNIADLETKTFIGSFKSDIKKSELDILTIYFKSIEENDTYFDFESVVNLSSNLKKEISGKIYKNNLSIVFDEDENDTFIIGIAEARIYNRKENLFIESTDPKAEQYWKLISNEK